MLGQRPLDAVAGDDAAVLGVRAPRLEQLAAQAGLHHARRGQHNAGADVVEVIDALKVQLRML